MIPKVIHFCWLSNDPYPDDIRRYIDNWRISLPDYELKLWNFERFTRGRSAWVDEAYDNHRYAFAADYLRCYALYHEGGIYLDTDVEVLRSFDPLLHLEYFMGFENGSGFIEAAVMGSEPGNPIFKALLDNYDSHHFKRDDATYDTTTLPRRLTHTIESLGLSIMPIADVSQLPTPPGTIGVLPYDYFSPIHNIDCRMMRTQRTYAIHRFAGSWMPWYRRLGRRIKRLVGPKAATCISKLSLKFKA